MYKFSGEKVRRKYILQGKYEKTRSLWLRVGENPGSSPALRSGEDFPRQDYCQRVSLSQSLGKPIALIMYVLRSYLRGGVNYFLFRWCCWLMSCLQIIIDYHRLS